MLSITIKPNTQHVIAGIQQCMEEPGLWPSALQSIARFLEVDSCALSDYDIPRAQLRLAYTHQVDAGFARDLQQRVPLNPILYALPEQVREAPYSACGYFGKKAFASSPWYKDALQSRNLQDAMLQVLSASPLRSGSFLAMREARNRPIETRDLSKLRLIAPHLKRAFSVSQRLEAASRREALLSGALDLLTTGLILVNRRGEIIHANRSAACALDAGTAIRRAGQVLSARNVQAARQLRQTLKNAASPQTPAQAFSVADILFPGEGGQDLIASVLRLGHGDALTPEDGCFAILLKPVSPVLPFSEDIFVEHYKLTRSECRTLSLLMQGKTLAESAEITSVSINTIRTHLKNLFSKTGARRQSELLQMAAMMTPPRCACHGQDFTSRDERD